MSRGRPLRFVALVLAGWTAGRVAMLTPSETARPAAAAERTRATAARPRAPAPAPAALRPDHAPLPVRVAGADRPRPGATRPLAAVGPATAGATAGAAPPLTRTRPIDPATTDVVAPLPAGSIMAPTRGGRLRVDGWLIARGRGGGGDPSLTPQLGGSQAGFRASYRLAGAAGPALFVRAATPWGTAGAGEVAAGVQWRPHRAPVTLLAEVRKLAGRPAAPVVGGFGGGDRSLGRFRLTGYAQGGYAAGRADTFYADGTVRLARAIATAGPARLDLGLAGWGAAQRGAARLDLGPGVAAALPLGAGGVRLGFDWRLRVAGDARPGSGPALTLAAGF